MTSIIGLPGSTISNQFAAQQTIAQLANDKIALQKLENQVSTGQALNLPSDNPGAALNAVNIQRARSTNSRKSAPIYPRTNPISPSPIAPCRAWPTC